MGKAEISPKGERTRRRIVDTARALFHTRGYTNTSMDDIVRKSRVTKGNLYYYFPSKEALGHAVVDEVIAEQFADSPAAGEGDPIRQIVEMFRRSEKALADDRCRGGCLFGNLALEVSDVHDGLRRKLEQAFSAWEGRIATVLASGVQEGVFAAHLDPESTARFVVAALEGGILLAKVKRDVAALTACAATVEHLLEGLRAPGLPDRRLNGARRRRRARQSHAT